MARNGHFHLERATTGYRNANSFLEGRSSFEAILADIQGSDLRLHCRSWHAEHGSRAGWSKPSSFASPQCGLNHLFFLRCKFLREAGLNSYLACKRLLSKPGLVDRTILCFAHDERSLNHVLQFAMFPVEAFFGYPLYVLFHFPRAMIDEVFDQHRNVFSSFPQRSHINRENVEPVKQVTTKGSRSDGLLQVAVRGSNHPYVGTDGASSADALKFVFLQLR
jgi:hypothetical protein